MGIADAVLLVFGKQLAVAAIDAGSKIKVIKLPAEGFVFSAVPDVCQRLLLHTAKAAAADLPVDMV